MTQPHYRPVTIRVRYSLFGYECVHIINSTTGQIIETFAALPKDTRKGSDNSYRGTLTLIERAMRYAKINNMDVIAHD